ncbi:peptidoglycan-binding lipoprotein ion transport porin, OmpA family [Psychroflexus torquis ATCC 700755]|uniref:Peptidoglycan-binding lipoprotein ion transport porin, OmpA family n=1 Tax=Psychroflexus torquis (strain ATCC 700755 / CIP 106069 / ACAM 623) TaxID=313595 RepID=K4IL71_PSYTT|nr:OmpA family protein [Psychroflexus torquis]AFU70518.1 peptidoglycan-binding lipoprotein ion transport porin, OmpA family [Psychroflexus torquis ATCC 700755]
MENNTIKCEKCNQLLSTGNFENDEIKICKECLKKSKRKRFLLWSALLIVLLGVVGIYFSNGYKQVPKSTFEGIIDKDTLQLKQEVVKIEDTSNPEIASKIDKIGESITNIESFKRILQEKKQLTPIGLMFTIDSKMINKSDFVLLDFYIEQYQALNKGYLLIEGYTCDLGTKSHNLELSERRNYSVEKYLIAKGIPSSKIKTKSYGEKFFERRPIIEESRIENRRVNLSIIESKK